MRTGVWKNRKSDWLVYVSMITRTAHIAIPVNYRRRRCDCELELINRRRRCDCEIKVGNRRRRCDCELKLKYRRRRSDFGYEIAVGDAIL